MGACAELSSQVAASICEPGASVLQPARINTAAGRMRSQDPDPPFHPSCAPEGKESRVRVIRGHRSFQTLQQPHQRLLGSIAALALKALGTVPSGTNIVGPETLSFSLFQDICDSIRAEQQRLSSALNTLVHMASGQDPLPEASVRCSGCRRQQWRSSPRSSAAVMGKSPCPCQQHLPDSKPALVSSRCRAQHYPFLTQKVNDFSVKSNISRTHPADLMSTEHSF